MPDELEQPSYPQTGIQITPQGMTIAYIHAPGYKTTQDIGPDLMNEIWRQWGATHPALMDELVKLRIEALREIKRHLELVPTTIQEIRNE